MVKASEPQVRSEILDLVEQLTDQLQTGNRSAIEEILRQHPDEATQLREILPSLEMLAVFQQTSGESTSPGAEYRPGVYSADPVQGVLGDFRIIHQIGRGGMGVVYEAQQISIQRTVALKVLPLASLVDSKALQRFKNEVTAIATLEHPHIVSVYAVGEERGIHYYAMRLIRGQSLAAVIRELRLRAEQQGSITGKSLSHVVSEMESQEENAGPVEDDQNDNAIETVARGQSTTDAAKITDPTYFRNVVRLILQATNALQHAHDHGIVHRDVKPGNLLLDKQGNLFVADFGLARIETGGGVTMTGDVLGTLRYMSPEQVLANRVVIDHRTDVYSLGATLYELLTLQPMWTGEDKADLIRQISFEEPTLPCRVNPTIPTDLETIVLKAIGKNPADRYVSGQAFADDLNNFIEHKPIAAQRPTTVQRIAKWSRRNPAVVISTAVILLLTTIGLVVSNALILRQKNIAERKTIEAKQQSQRAERNLDQALEAIRLVESIFDDLDLWSIDNDPNETLRSVLVERLVSASSQLNQSVGDELRIAEIQDKLGNSLVSLGAANESIEILNDSLDSKMSLLKKTDPELVKTKHLLAVSYREAERGHLRRAISLLKEVVAFYEDTEGAQNPNTIKSMCDLASCYIHLGEPDRAIDLLQKSHSASIIANGQKHSQTIEIENSLGTCYWKLSRHEKAIPIFQQVSEYYEQELGPDSPYFMNAINNLGQAYVGAKDFESALPLLTKSFNWAYQNIGPEHPSTRNYMNNLALLMVHRGEAERGAELLESLVELSADEFAEGDAKAAHHMKNLAACYARLGRTEDAIRLMEDAHKSPFDHVVNKVFPVLLQLYMKDGQLSEAVSLAENELQKYQNDSSRSPNELANNKAFISETCLIPAKRFQQAEKLLYDALSVFEASGNDKRVVSIKSMLVKALVAQERFPEAETHLLAKHDWILEVARSAKSDRAFTEARQSFAGLIEFYDKWHAFDTDGKHELKRKQYKQQLEEFVSEHSSK